VAGKASISGSTRLVASSSGISQRHHLALGLSLSIEPLGAGDAPARWWWPAADIVHPQASSNQDVAA
jgi:hypothetical protein